MSDAAENAREIYVFDASKIETLCLFRERDDDVYFHHSRNSCHDARLKIEN
jgi:hypothetical protein